MKISLNREYAVRHLGVAILLAGLCGWFCFDGGIKWPNENATWEKRTGQTAQGVWDKHRELRHILDKANRDDVPPHWPIEITRQFQFAGLTGLAALIIALLILRDWKCSLEWDDTKLWGSVIGRDPLLFTDITKLDDSKWSKKGIFYITTNTGKRITLDAWHHVGIKELVAKIQSVHSATSENKSE